jgi:hypothetical protein
MRVSELLEKSASSSFRIETNQERNEEILRRQEEIVGEVEIAAQHGENDGAKIILIVRNKSDFDGSNREEALMRSTVSTHLVLHVENGEFVSLLEPQEKYEQTARSCTNIGNWPVLIGEDRERDTLLASPIILYDYPQVAPESPGDLFDSTEIDEILMLRILTLTDQEKEEMRNVDERARRLLERTENLPPEHFMKLHGAIRGMKRTEPEEVTTEVNLWSPWEEKPPLESVLAFGKEVRKGDRVRLWPVKTADILDLALNGKVAIVDSIEEDYDGQVHLAVLIEEDPGKDLGEMRQVGHRFFFTPEEVEPL